MYAAPALLALLAAPGDTYPLQWKLRAGDVFYTKAAVDMDQVVEIDGRKLNQKVGVRTVVRFKVRSADRDGAVVEMTYLEHKVEAQGLPGADIGARLDGVTLTATLDAGMGVVKLDGYDKFLDALSDGDEAQRAVIRTMMPEAGVRQVFSQTFAAGPGRPVAVGDRWDRTDKVSLGQLGSVRTKSDFKLDRVKADVATVAVKGDLAFEAGGGEDAGLPFKVTKADLTADRFSGSYEFDLKAGRVTESRVEMELSGTMTIEVGGKKADARLVQKTTTVARTVDKNPVKD